MLTWFLVEIKFPFDVALIVFMYFSFMTFTLRILCFLGKESPSLDRAFFIKKIEGIYLLVKKEAGILSLRYAVTRFNRTSRFNPQG